MAMTKTEKAQLQALKYVVHETLWMAARYAHKRRTFAPTTFNEAVDLLDSVGLVDLWKCTIQPDVEGFGKYVEDGDFGHWVPELKRFEKA